MEGERKNLRVGCDKEGREEFILAEWDRKGRKWDKNGVEGEGPRKTRVRWKWRKTEWRGREGKVKSSWGMKVARGVVACCRTGRGKAGWNRAKQSSVRGRPRQGMAGERAKIYLDRAEGERKGE